MIIKNFDALALTPTRKDALTILEAGYQSLDTKKAIAEFVRVEGDILKIGELTFSRSDIGKLYVVGIGKCAFQSAEALEQILGDWITDGVIIDVQGGVLQRMKSYVGTHPLPTQVNVTAAGAVMAMAKNATKDDLVLTIISGGGSALLCWPHQMKCEEMVRITEALMHAGATISEMNTVRKHLSEVQGGQLAKLAYPARVVSLIFSDVPGDDLQMVASGPTVMDTTTIDDAARILAKYDVLTTCQLPNCDLIETPKEAKYFEHVSNLIVVNSQRAINAMMAVAKELQYTVESCGHCLEGEAKMVGADLAEAVKPGYALIGAGETTVTLFDDAGEGGRNQETVLGALPHLREHAVFISAGSDGEDHGSMAGAIGDGQSLSRAKALGLNYEVALEHHDTFAFFKALGDLIDTGKTGANVSDLFISLKKKE